jgi:hypothetical protein
MDPRVMMSLMCDAAARRDFAPEPSPILSMRVSPSGAHLLIIVRGAPAELWGVSPRAWLCPLGIY